jgi:hypothetical protein
MKLIYKEDPREWRKSALLAALGLAILSSFLCWRRHLPINCWSVLAELILLIIIGVALRPRWFREWYRFSLWLGFHSSQFTGRCVLLLIFIFIITPLGCVLRLRGKDLLQLKRPREAKTFWHSSKDGSPMDRLF